MRPAESDHLIVTAATLDEGVAWVESQLGVSLSPRRGGEHDRQGTHNALLSLGPDFYLEVIAINPSAPAPAHARWFGMEAISDTPRLHHWVLRTADLETALADSVLKTGDIQEMTRGSLRWLITIAADGALAADGAMPSMIQWKSAPHPATTLPDIGCRLHSLEIAHPRAQDISQSFANIGLDDPRVSVTTGPLRLKATIDTPTGPRVLEG